MLVTLFGVCGTVPAAIGSSSWHNPSCVGYSTCNDAGHSDGGYSSRSSTSYWHQYGGHNCTNYVAYRLVRNGASANYGPFSGNAESWGADFKNLGHAPNSTLAVGAIAWWKANANPYVYGSGHVAYVERVNSDGSMVVTDDNYGGNFDSRTYDKSTYFPTGFIHLKDIKPAGHKVAAEVRQTTVVDTDGRVDYLGIGADGYANKRYQQSPGGTTNDWYRFGDTKFAK